LRQRIAGRSKLRPRKTAEKNIAPSHCNLHDVGRGE
jgi:hypothetical protein